MLELSYISLSYFVLLNQSHTKKQERELRSMKAFMAGKSVHNERPSTSHTNEKLFDLSITHDTMEIPFECLENRSRKKENQSLS